MIVLDTSGLLAALDSGQEHHDEARRVLLAASPPFLLSPFILAELDYLVGRRVGARASRRFVGEVARGAYQLIEFDRRLVASCLTVMEQFPDIGLADASVCVLAHRFGTNDILTLDQRHFRVLPGVGGPAFRILPADG